jgi:hypothetical protein
MNSNGHCCSVGQYTRYSVTMNELHNTYTFCKAISLTAFDYIVPLVVCQFFLVLFPFVCLGGGEWNC